MEEYSLAGNVCEKQMFLVPREQKGEKTYMVERPLEASMFPAPLSMSVQNRKGARELEYF